MKKKKEKNHHKPFDTLNIEGSNSNNRVIINEYFTEYALVSIYVFISVKEHKMHVHFGPYHVFKSSLNFS